MVHDCWANSVKKGPSGPRRPDHGAQGAWRLWPKSSQTKPRKPKIKPTQAKSKNHTEKTLTLNIFFNCALIMKVNSSMKRPWIGLLESTLTMTLIIFFHCEKLQNMIFFWKFFLQWKITKVDILLLRFNYNNILLFLCYFKAKNTLSKKSYLRSKLKIFPKNIS